MLRRALTLAIVMLLAFVHLQGAWASTRLADPTDSQAGHALVAEHHHGTAPTPAADDETLNSNGHHGDGAACPGCASMVGYVFAAAPVASGVSCGWPRDSVAEVIVRAPWRPPIA